MPTEQAAGVGAQGGALAREEALAQKGAQARVRACRSPVAWSVDSWNK